MLKQSLLEHNFRAKISQEFSWGAAKNILRRKTRCLDQKKVVMMFYSALIKAFFTCFVTSSACQDTGYSCSYGPLSVSSAAKFTGHFILYILTCLISWYLLRTWGNVFIFIYMWIAMMVHVYSKIFQMSETFSHQWGCGPKLCSRTSCSRSICSMLLERE